MPLKMFFSLIVILFTVIESLHSICHKRCVCMNRVGLLQCTDLMFRGSMTWIKTAVFTTSVVDTNLLIRYAQNLKGIKLHNCVIVSCN